MPYSSFFKLTPPAKLTISMIYWDKGIIAYPLPDSQFAKDVSEIFRKMKWFPGLLRGKPIDAERMISIRMKEY